MKKLTPIGPIILITLWFIISKLNIVDSFFLPGPFVTLRELLVLFGDGSVIDDLGMTIGRVLVSFVLAVLIGLPTGLFLGSAEKIYRSFESVIDFFRSIPATALFPLFLLIFGISDTSKIAVAVFTSSLIIIFNTAYGVMHSSKSRILAAKIMGASRMQIFRNILLWESLPQTFVGLRSAASLALVVIIVTEMFIGTSVGLGRMIIDAQITYEIQTMYAVIILTGSVGYIFNQLFVFVEKKVLHWTRR